MRGRNFPYILRFVLPLTFCYPNLYKSLTDYPIDFLPWNLSCSICVAKHKGMNDNDIW